MPVKMTRRALLASTAAVPLATSFSTVRAQENDGAKSNNIGEIVDAHVHIWTSDTKKFPLAAGFSAKDLWFPSYSAEELMELGKVVGVGRFNLVQMTWYGVDHSYILDVISRNPKQFVGTGIVPAVTDVSLADPGATMIDLSRGGVYAFRIRGKSTRPKFTDGERWMDHPGYDKMFTAGAEHNLALSYLMSPFTRAGSYVFAVSRYARDHRSLLLDRTKKYLHRRGDSATLQDGTAQTGHG